MAGGADFAPTDTQMDTLQSIEAEMASANKEFQKVLKEDLPAFNRVLGDHNIALVVAATSSDPDQQHGN